MTARNLPTPLERDVQSSLIAQLEALGYLVMHTDQRRRSGVSIGLPDLYVTRRGWGNRWKAIEVKRPRIGKPSPAQQRLIDAGHVGIATCLEEALEILRQIRTGRR
jgi:hypothetical protein